MGLFYEKFLQCPNCGGSLLTEEMTYGLDTSDKKVYKAIEVKKNIICKNCNTVVLSIPIRQTTNFDIER